MLTTIFELADLVQDPVTRSRVCSVLKTHANDMSAGYSGDSGRHHYYPGGLLDHTMLTTILAVIDVKRCVTELRTLCNLDDVIIACIFHDFDKIVSCGQHVYRTKLEVVGMLENEGILNVGIRDGILHSRGGWSAYQEQESGMAGITVHRNCMIASAIFKDKDVTERLIDDLTSYFR